MTGWIHSCCFCWWGSCTILTFILNTDIIMHHFGFRWLGWCDLFFSFIRWTRNYNDLWRWFRDTFFIIQFADKYTVISTITHHFIGHLLDIRLHYPKSKNSLCQDIIKWFSCHFPQKNKGFRRDFSRKQGQILLTSSRIIKSTQVSHHITWSMWFQTTTTSPSNLLLQTT